eukprot:2270891-Prymnesium_polylepis.1
MGVESSRSSPMAKSSTIMMSSTVCSASRIDAKSSEMCPNAKWADVARKRVIVSEHSRKLPIQSAAW